MWKYLLVWNSEIRLKLNSWKLDQKLSLNWKAKHPICRNANYARKDWLSIRPAWELQILLSNAFESHKWHDGSS